MPKTSRQVKRVQRVRWLALGGVGAFAAVVVAIGFYHSLDVAPGEYREGEHYYALVGGTSDPDAPIVVTEFFSYGCIHCRNFDPQIKPWAANLPEGTELVLSPVTFNATWRMYAQMYYMAKELGVLDRAHGRLFADVHDRGRTITTQAQIRDFFVGLGVARDRVSRSLRSPVVARKLNNAEALARTVGVRSVPTLMVANSYLIQVGDVGRLQALAIAEHLIEKETTARTASLSEPTPTEERAESVESE
ncbi:MAG: thiol:disulfide interchange protein DsbA/DsbL [Pseudomonadales bacterium]